MHKAMIIAMLAAVTSWGAVGYDGANQYHESDADIPVTGSANRTLLFWAQADSTALTMIMECGTDADSGGGAGERFGIGFQDTATTLICAVNSGNRKWNLNTAASDGAWHHYAVVLDGTTTSDLAAYQDGVEMAVNGTVARTIATASDTAMLGIAHDLGEDFDGRIDDARIYSTALTSNQIASIIIDTCDKFVPEHGTNTTLIANQDPAFDPRESNTNLVAMWDSDYLPVADGNAITGTWHDATGNGNDATAVNNPTREAAR